MLKQFLIVALTFIYFAVAFSSCNLGRNSGGTNADTVITSIDTLQRDGEFTKSNGEKCHQHIIVTITYPKHYSDAKATRRLQQLFAKELLYSPDSISLNQAMERYAMSILIQDSPRDIAVENVSYSDADSEGSDMDDIDIENITTNIDIYVVYNDHGIVSFAKQEKVTKNGHLTSVAHHYYNFDLKAMALIELNRLFNDANIDDITALLKDKLLEQNNVSTEEELNELGYFNLPNLTTTNNFYFTPDGITWSYEPNALAISAVGEPQISLNYSQLASFTLDSSIINRF